MVECEARSPRLGGSTVAELLLGIDGGGSKTRALVATLDGEVLGAGSAPTSNYQAVGLEAATNALRCAIAQALAAVAETRGEPATTTFAAAVLGLAGVDRPNDEAIISDWLDREGIAQRHRVLNDAELLLTVGTPAGWGIALISGTGSICYGRTPDGRVERAGGWGWLLGDEGSGYDLGVQALRLATQTADGRADAPEVLAAVLEAFALPVADDLVNYVYQRGVSQAEVALLASRLVALSDDGSPAARECLEAAGQSLAHHVAVVAGKLGCARPPLVFGGGLLLSCSSLQRTVRERCGVELGPTVPVTDAALGAIAIARRLAAGETVSAP